MIYSVPNSLLTEAFHSVEGNVEEFLKLEKIDVYDNNLKTIISVDTKDFVKVVNDAMYKITSEYKFFSLYIRYSKVFFIPTYPSSMGINTMAVDGNHNLWMNVHFIYNSCKMNKDRVFGIIFHELMHNLLNHQKREEKIYPIEHRTKEHHQKCNICQDYEVNTSMVADGIVGDVFWKKMGGLYKSEYTGKRWEDILAAKGDDEYNEYLEKCGVKLSDKTKEALDAIERALKTLRDTESTDAEKERAKDILKRKMDEMYGKRDRKIIDKADLAGLKRELEKLMDSRLGDIGDLASKLQNVIDDLGIHPKDMTDHDVSVTVSDINFLKREMLKHAERIAKTFRKTESEITSDVKQAMKSLVSALNVMSDGSLDEREERKVIRKAKDDLEAIILTEVDKKRKEEKRSKDIDKHKERLKKEKKEKETVSSSKPKKKDSPKDLASEIKKEEEKIEKLKKRNPIKKFVDTFKNLRELIKVDRISEETYLSLDTIIPILDNLSEKNIQDITKSDINEVFDLLDEIRENVINDLLKLDTMKIVKISKSGADSFTKDIFDSVKKFFDVLVDEDEPSSVKFGAMSLAVEELRKLGKKLKSQKKIKPSKEWIDTYKETKKRLIDIYKKGGKEALAKEIRKMGVDI